MRSLLYSLVFLLPAQAVAAVTPGDALAEYSLQQYDKAYQEWQVLAAHGSIEAEFYLGLLYETGRGVTPDARKAGDCYLKAANGGHPEAAYRLSRLARQTSAVTASSQDVLKWIRQAAGGGIADAQYELGAMLAEGKHVPQDLRAAEDWFKRAATGFTDAAKRRQAERMRRLVAERIADR